MIQQNDLNVDMYQTFSVSQNSSSKLQFYCIALKTVKIRINF